MVTPHPSARCKTAGIVELISRARDIPTDVWNQLAGPDQPMWSQGFLQAMENGSLGPTSIEYLVRRRADRVIAVLPINHFRRLDLLGLLGRDTRHRLKGVRRAAPRLFRINAIFAGHLLGQGRMLLAPGEDVSESAGAFLTELQNIGRARRAPWIVWKDLPDDQVHCITGPARQHKFFTVPALPDTVLELPDTTFDGFVAALPGKPRRNTRAKARRFAASGMRIETTRDFEAIAAELNDLYRNVLDRAESQLDIITTEFLQQLSRSGDVDSECVVVTDNDVPVAFLVLLFAGTAAAAFRVGLDYSVSSQAALYHNVHYRGIESALQRRCTTMTFFPTAYEPKMELGCQLVPLTNIVTHANPMLRKLLAWTLPKLVASA